jgi:hypothetical protein
MKTVERTGSGFVRDRDTGGVLQVLVRYAEASANPCPLVWIGEREILLGEIRDESSRIWIDRSSGRQRGGDGWLSRQDLQRLAAYEETEPPWDQRRWDARGNRVAPSPPKGVTRNRAHILMDNGTPVEVLCWSGHAAVRMGVARVHPGKIITLETGWPREFLRSTNWTETEPDAHGQRWQLKAEDAEALQRYAEPEPTPPPAEEPQVVQGLNGMRQPGESADAFRERVILPPPPSPDPRPAKKLGGPKARAH